MELAGIRKIDDLMALNRNQLRRRAFDCLVGADTNPYAQPQVIYELLLKANIYATLAAQATE